MRECTVGAVNAAARVFAVEGVYAGAVNAAARVFAVEGVTVGAVNAASRVFAVEGVYAGAVNAAARVFAVDGVMSLNQNGLVELIPALAGFVLASAATGDTTAIMQNAAIRNNVKVNFFIQHLSLRILLILMRDICFLK